MKSSSPGSMVAAAYKRHCSVATFGWRAWLIYQKTDITAKSAGARYRPDSSNGQYFRCESGISVISNRRHGAGDVAGRNGVPWLICSVAKQPTPADSMVEGCSMYALIALFKPVVCLSASIRDTHHMQIKSPRVRELLILVRMRGLEPPQGCPHYHLKVACLPFHHIRVIETPAILSVIAEKLKR